MPIVVDVKVTPTAPLQYKDLKPGDVFTWGNGSNWYIKTHAGYMSLDSTAYSVTDVYVHTYGTFREVFDLRVAKKATLTIEV